MELREKIKFFREEQGLTTYQLAELMKQNGYNISQSTISKIENGNRKIEYELLISISNTLGIPIDKFFNNTIEFLNESGNLSKAELNIIHDCRKKTIEYAPINSLLEALESSIEFYLHSKKFDYDKNSIKFIINRAEDSILRYIDEFEINDEPNKI